MSTFRLRANWSPNLTKVISENVFKKSLIENATEDENKTFFLDSFDQVDQLQRPRFIKTHLHYSLLPEAMKHDNSPKMVYVARNPKDTCISLFHHFRLMDGYGGSLDDFVESFVTDNGKLSKLHYFFFKLQIFSVLSSCFILQFLPVHIGLTLKSIGKSETGLMFST